MVVINDQLASGLLVHVQDLPDPCEPRGVRHHPSSVIVLSLLAGICGANPYRAVRGYAVSNVAWFGVFLALPHGAPSQDTGERVFQVLDLDAWRAGERPRANSSYATWAMRSLCCPRLWMS